MKYYSLLKYANTPVGAIFECCDGGDLEECQKRFNPDSISEISQEEYEAELERGHRVFMRSVTGYPKK